MHIIGQSARRRRMASLGAIAGVILLGVVACHLSAPALGNEGETKSAAKRIVDLAGVNRGLCAVLGGDRAVLAELVQSTELLIHVRDPRGDKVTALRNLAEEVGVGIDRLVFEQGSANRLSFADNMIDVVIVLIGDDGLGGLKVAEVLRALRPEGRAIVYAAGGSKTNKLEEWAKGGEAENVKAWKDDSGAWLRFSKPELEGADEWTHWEHRPDNNPVSTDQVIKAPYLTQFLAEPYYIGMPSITTAAGGRTFLATGHIAHHTREWDMLNKLIARNGYNGIVLWQRDLPEGYLSHRSAFVASKDVFYMMDGGSCLMLDPQTGEEKGRIKIPGLGGDWKWMAIVDGVLLAMTGESGGEAKIIKGDRNFGGWSWADLSEGYYGKPRVPWGFGRTLAAYRLDDKRVLWRHNEKTLMDSRGLAMRDGKLFLYCPDKHLRCLDSYTGKVIWTNNDPNVLRLIEQPGRGLTSTPGFRSSCITVAGADALIIQGQTRMKVIAVSTEDGKLLWQKNKISNNPNVIFVDDLAVLGVGPGSSHQAIDPVSGKVIENLKFRKAACTRLTASPDSFFVRGEGLLRFDRASKRVLVDGAARPACNDGALAANGMLYIGPWACDCGLSLIGAIAKCSAGAWRFDHAATEAERLHRGSGNIQKVEPLRISPTDWPTYRGNNQRTGSTTARLARPNAAQDAPAPRSWTYAPRKAHIPTPPVCAGGLVFTAGADGKVRAIDAKTGRLRWSFATSGPIKMPATIAESRAYVGSGDGYVYALEAATGRLLWRFRAAPFERQIMVYGNLCSTWPVNTGVLVKDGVAYFAAGIIDSDGTYVYALDAKTGKIKWQNYSCGHLNAELRKGVSAQGNLTIQGNQLLMAGGNQVNPARFELATGKCLNQTFAQGNPKANHGKFAGMFLGKYPIVGGRTLYASAENVANKDSFVVNNGRRALPLNFGGIPPAWNGNTVAMVNFRDGRLGCYDAGKVGERIEKGFPQTDKRSHWSGLANTFGADGAIRWTSDLGEPGEFEIVSLAVCPTAVVAVGQYQTRNRAHSQWFLAALNSRDGTSYWFWRYPLPSKPLPGGLLVGRQGQVVVTLLNGNVLSFGPQRPRQPRRADQPQPARRRAVRD